MAYHKKIRRGGATTQTARRRRNPEGRPDIRRIAASFVVTDALVSIASSSLLVLLASPGVAAAMVIRIGSWAQVVATACHIGPRRL